VKFLGESAPLINEVKGVNRVVYHVKGAGHDRVEVEKAEAFQVSYYR
jgi:hypothetical protein